HSCGEFVNGALTMRRELATRTRVFDFPESTPASTAITCGHDGAPHPLSAMAATILFRRVWARHSARSAQVRKPCENGSSQKFEMCDAQVELGQPPLSIRDLASHEVLIPAVLRLAREIFVGVVTKGDRRTSQHVVDPHDQATFLNLGRIKSFIDG